MVDDLISRQAVLEATSTTLKITGKENAETVYEYIKKLCDDIKALPSAQQWIPCSERLPERTGWYIFTDGSDISVERYKTDAIDHFFPQGRWFCFDEAIAWMPLPSPYREETES